MDVQSVIDRVDHILIEEFELDPADVVPEARLREDLELDSLDGMDLLVALEKELGIRVDENQLMKLSTVGEVHELLRSHLASATA
jgi:acyl carrier protein